MEVPKKIFKCNYVMSSASAFGYLSKQTQNAHLKEYMHLYAHCRVTYTTAKIRKQPLGQTDYKAVVYPHSGILLGHEKEWNLTICDSMDGP